MMKPLEKWLEKYRSDPEFRLKRLLRLARRHPKKYGSPGPRDNPYEHDIRAARAEIAKKAASATPTKEPKP